MGWLAWLTDLVQPYAPLIYGVAALLGALVVALSLALFGLYRSYMGDADFRKASASDVKSVNYLEEYFNKIAVRINDFEPLFGPYQGKKFTDCDIIGPAIIALSGQFHFKDTHWARTDVIVINDEPPKINNAIVFDNTSFVRCRFYSITILVVKNDVPKFSKMFSNQPVVWLNKAD